MTKHSSDSKVNELLALSEEVSRVAESLAQLALEPGTQGPLEQSGSRHDVSRDAVARLIRARRGRVGYLPQELLAEPVWDILLHLLHEEMSQCRVSVSRAVAASGVPERVGQRWLNALAERRLILLSMDAAGEEVIELAPRLSAALRRSVSEVIDL